MSSICDGLFMEAIFNEVTQRVVILEVVYLITAFTPTFFIFGIYAHILFCASFQEGDLKATVIWRVLICYERLWHILQSSSHERRSFLNHNTYEAAWRSACRATRNIYKVRRRGDEPKKIPIITQGRPESRPYATLKGY